MYTYPLRANAFLRNLERIGSIWKYICGGKREKVKWREERNAAEASNKERK